MKTKEYILAGFGGGAIGGLIACFGIIPTLFIVILIICFNIGNNWVNNQND